MLYGYLQQGGPMMWPLLACSIALVALLLERGIGLGWHSLARSIRSTKSARRRRRLRQRRRGWAGLTASAPARLTIPRAVPAFFWEIPPQLGLLGTVIGLVQIFRGGLEAQAFGEGVGVACLTTIFGIGIAVVARTSSHVLHALAGLPATPAGGEA